MSLDYSSACINIKHVKMYTEKKPPKTQEYLMKQNMLLYVLIKYP